MLGKGDGKVASGLVWHDSAKGRLGNVPIFVRVIVKKSVEKYAKRMGYTEITETVWEEAKKEFGM